MSNNATQIAQSYVIDGIKNRDLSKVPIDPNVVFQGPFQEKDAPLVGVDALQEFLNGIYPLIKDARILNSISNGGEVCIRWELETNDPPAVIPILEYFRVSNGSLVEIRPFYDPRVITNAPSH